MPTLNYYCHSCQQEVSLRDGDYICDSCGGEFIEEIAQEANEDYSNAIEMVIENVFPRDPASSGNFGGARSVRTFRREDIGGEDIVGVFLNQLLSNLLPQGAAIQFHFDGPVVGAALHGNIADYVWEDGGLDHIVTQLLNQFEGGATPVDTRYLGNLPMTGVQQKDVESGTQCTTCMEHFKTNESVAQLDCQHIFHRDCILPWLKRQNTCPICRKAVDASKWPSRNLLDELD